MKLLLFTKISLVTKTIISGHVVIYCYIYIQFALKSIEYEINLFLIDLYYRKKKFKCK